MTHKELIEKIDLTLAQNRAAIERSRHRDRELARLSALSEAITDRVVRELRQAARRR
jgi:hypothetical protein